MAVRRPAAHRAQILSAAARLFAQRPYHEVRMEEVAAGAGVAKGTLYNCYRDKAALYAAVSLDLLEKLLGDLERLAREAAPAAVRLRRMILAVVDHFLEQKDNFQVMQRQWAERGAVRRSCLVARRAAARKLFASVIREGQAAGELRPVNARAAADMLLGMVRALVRFGENGLTSRVLAERVEDLFFRGAAARTGKGRAR